MRKLLMVAAILSLAACKSDKKKETKTTVVTENTKTTTSNSSVKPFVWEAANIYFLLTDRFNNGDTSNDLNFERSKETGKLRGFMGGDLKGITQKIKEGYFTSLGINAIWMTPVTEQIHGSVDEGTGNSYGFHGYWAKDWTSLDPNYGTKEDLAALVEAAHANGIRVLLDAVINHTGPATDTDPAWEENWVRTEPQCEYNNYKNTISCTLVKNLPDIKTESNENVALPAALVKKWKAEGRYDKEVAELDAFFERTGYPRAPRFYIMKWLTDYITEFGIDGYRVDTVKHTEEYVWDEFKKECDYAFAAWKKTNPEKVLDDNGFYTVGEVYGYGIGNGLAYDFGDKKVNFFDNGFNSLINFQFKYDAQKSYEELFSYYDEQLQGPLRGKGVLNYLSSHDDGQPFDKQRAKPYEAAIKLLLAPGTSQVYYGDETARPLDIEGTEGDATLRSFMNWDTAKNNPAIKELLVHWQKLGTFRNEHPAIGAGLHTMISEEPYMFRRDYSIGGYNDQVVVGIGLPEGKKDLEILSIFPDGTVLKDHYSGKKATIENGRVLIDTPYDIVLLSRSEDQTEI
ncbi:alpha-amylase family glycosyl hydrolase [Sungkyunkwania multivorans]|uniref:Alpha-amylase family glycosyl hydrolase n=1 Tax=Sungkyunkwania multivorans TaxID=1173618 RepID=A0ABW3CXB3_9FLAO